MPGPLPITGPVHPDTLGRMRVLVTGGTGYLGRELVARGCLGASRSTGADVRDEEAVRHALDGMDAVIHTAYVQDGPEVAIVNKTIYASCRDPEFLEQYVVEKFNLDPERVVIFLAD